MGGLDLVISRLELVMRGRGLSIPRGPHGWGSDDWPRLLETASDFERYVYGVVLSRDALRMNGVRALATAIAHCLSTRYSEMPEYEALAQFSAGLAPALMDRRIGVVLEAVTHMLSVSAYTRVLVFTSLKSMASMIADGINCHPGRALTFFGGPSYYFEEDPRATEQAENLQKFNSGAVRGLVSTAFGDDNLDISSVDYLICFDLPDVHVRLILRRA